ncbi:MAG TPA: ATP-dependent zinc protease [Anaerolineales bacterium]|nr:ATP-dependent zinc protease [Anaerolineales bacterium]
MTIKKGSHLPIIGWREWVGLPEFGIKAIKVKVDTGARSSSLHASDLREFDRDGEKWVRFKVHPIQRKREVTVEIEARIIDYRSVRSSSGKASIRPVVSTQLTLLGVTWSVELTLASRDKMGFRMLLGREAFRGRFLVDAGKSYFGGQPKKGKNTLPQTGGESPNKAFDKSPSYAAE